MSGSNELVPVEAPDDAPNVGEEDARQFILKVKQTMERCLAQGMNKEQMFRMIREEGLHPGAAFAVYKELRQQNHGFFQEYYCTIDLKEQHQRLNHLVHAYRTGGRNTGDGVRVPETVTPPLTMEETDVPINIEWPDQQTLQTWLTDGGHQLASPALLQQATHLLDGEQVPNHGQPVVASNALPDEIACPQQTLNMPAREQPLADGAFQGVARPQQALNLPASEQLHSHGQPLADGAFQGVAQQLYSGVVQVGLHNDAMMDPWSPSHGDASLW